MTTDQAIQKLKEIQNSDDQEQAHMDADKVLCDFLIACGHDDVVAEFKKVPKWYV